MHMWKPELASNGGICNADSELPVSNTIEETLMVPRGQIVPFTRSAANSGWGLN
jgi:hypothetical protein